LAYFIDISAVNMGEEQVKLMREVVGSGMVMDLQRGSRYWDLVKEMLRENFSPTNYEALLPAFMRPLLEKANDNGPVLLSLVAFQQDLVIPVATYYYEGKRYFSAAINTIVLEEFSTDDVDDYNNIVSDRILGSLKELRMPFDLESEILSGIVRKVEVMSAYLAGKVFETDVIRV